MTVFSMDKSQRFQQLIDRLADLDSSDRNVIGPFKTGVAFVLERTVQGVSIRHEVRVPAGMLLRIAENEQIIYSGCGDPSCPGCSPT